MILLLLLAVSWALQAQWSPSARDLLAKREDTLSVLAYAVVNDSLPENRFAACQSLIKMLVRTLKTENSFRYPFDQLKSVSIQYPADSSFRLFSWQLYVDQDEYRYYGAIQRNSRELDLYPLIDRSWTVKQAEQQVLPPDQWYGAVYYNLKQVDGPQGRYYLLFGFDGYSFFRKRKVVDVLVFEPAGKPQFGAPVFLNEADPDAPRRKNRLIVEYSAASSVRLNWDPALELLVFDHLQPIAGPHGEGMVNVPDGSYQGYQLQAGYWYYVPKVFDQAQEDAPRPFPVLKNRKKDLFGKEGGG